MVTEEDQERIELCKTRFKDTDEETTDVNGVNSWNFKCNLCEEKIVERRDFMTHKKTKHGDTVLACQNFKRGECSRSEESCWFKHVEDDQKSEKMTNQDFHKAQPSPYPPDQLVMMLNMMNKLCSKVENMERKFQDIME